VMAPFHTFNLCGYIAGVKSLYSYIYVAAIWCPRTKLLNEHQSNTDHQIINGHDQRSVFKIQLNQLPNLKID